MHQKPCGLLNVEGYFDGLLAFAGHMVDEGFVRREQRTMISVASDADALIDTLGAYTPAAVEKWIDRAAT